MKFFDSSGKIVDRPAPRFLEAGRSWWPSVESGCMFISMIQRRGPLLPPAIRRPVHPASS
jgi:hypothetical protein